MLARDLAEQVPVVTADTTGAEAVRLMAEYRLSGLVVSDASGRPLSVIPGSQVLGLIVPEYVFEHPTLAHVVDEQAADELCGQLNDITLGKLLQRDRLQEVRLPTVLPQDTLLEVAAVMLRGHFPLIVIRDERGAYGGVVTMSRLMAHIAQVAGQDSPLVRRRLERDIIDRGRPWPADERPDAPASPAEDAGDAEGRR